MKRAEQSRKAASEGGQQRATPGGNCESKKLPDDPNATSTSGNAE
jgi:hypothetical protein